MRLEVVILSNDNILSRSRDCGIRVLVLTYYIVRDKEKPNCPLWKLITNSTIECDYESHI